MPVVLGQAPVMAAGIPGTTFNAELYDYAYIRTTPDESSPLLVVSLPPETSMLVTGRNSDWYRVLYEGQEGWIYADNLRVMGPIPSLPYIEL